MLLQVSDLSFSYETPILKKVSFNLHEGEIICIVGKSGIGKTTLLKLIAGLLDAKDGMIFFQSNRVFGPAHNLVPGHVDIQLVNQDFALDIYHTVEENIREKILYLPIKERNELVSELLELIELTPIKNQKALLLSGGEQQRLSLARALACEPKILLLDEPFVHLDSRLRSKISTYLMKLKKKRKMGMILVSHDGAEVLSLASKIIHFEKGIVKRIDSPEEFYFNPNSIIEAEIFGNINKVQLNGKTILFRPNEFELKKKSKNKLKVKFIESEFFGSYFVNHFITSNKEKIQLYHSEILDETEEISIKKRY